MQNTFRLTCQVTPGELQPNDVIEFALNNRPVERYEDFITRRPGGALDTIEITVDPVHEGFFTCSLSSAGIFITQSNSLGPFLGTL